MKCNSKTILVSPANSFGRVKGTTMFIISNDITKITVLKKDQTER